MNERSNLNEHTTAFWGQLVYRSAVGVSAVIVILGILTAFYNADRAFPSFPIIPLLLAAIIWGIGWLVRKILVD